MKATTTLLTSPGCVEVVTVDVGVGSEHTIARVTACGVCGTDVHLCAGNGLIPMPISLGHEFVVEIVEAGTALRSVTGETVQAGDRVVVVPGRSCGDCPACRQSPGLTNLCEHRVAHGLGSFDTSRPLLGGMSDVVVLEPGTWVCPVPPQLDDVTAALTEPAAVAIRIAERASFGPRPDIGLGPTVGDVAAVVGLGPLGSMTAVVLAMKGFDVVASDPLEHRRSVAATFGIAAVDPDEIAYVVASRTGGRGPAVVVDASGTAATFAESVRMVRRGGRVVEAGCYFPNGGVEFDPSEICRRDLEVVGAALGPREAYPSAIRLLTSDLFPWTSLVTDRYTLDAAPAALDVAARRSGGKVVVVGEGR